MLLLVYVKDLCMKTKIYFIKYNYFNYLKKYIYIDIESYTIYVKFKLIKKSVT